MPHIDIKVLEGVFNDTEKERILLDLIAAFGKAAGGNFKENTSAKIIEIKSGSWASGDQIFRTEFGLAIKNDKS